MMRGIRGIGERYDAVVVGGGPAGLAAALWLGRYRQSVCLIDAQSPRSAATWAIHGYLGVPDPAPMELRGIGRRQAEEAGAELFDGEIVEVNGKQDAFEVALADGRRTVARRVLFATGLLDIIPEIPGLLDFYGSSIWHCPDCDGPAAVGREVGVIGWGRPIAAFCMQMLTWTDRLTILSHGHEPDLPLKSRAALRRFEIPIRTAPIRRIEGREGAVEHVVFEDGTSLPVDVVFFHIASGPACSIPADLGCEANAEGILKVNEEFETTVPGIFAAGDITHGSKLAIRAAADGVRAAVGIYRSLMPEERRV